MQPIQTSTSEAIESKAIGNTAAETPNHETIKACKELIEGEGITFTSLDELFKYLKN